LRSYFRAQGLSRCQYVAFVRINKVSPSQINTSSLVT